MPIPEAVAARIILYTLNYLRGMTIYAERRGQKAIRFPHLPDPLPTADAHAHIRARLSDPAVKRYATQGNVWRLAGRSNMWSWDDPEQSVWDIEVVETLAWALGLRSQMPPWDGFVNGAVSMLPALAGKTVEEIVREARPRSRDELLDARAQAAAWRWRAWAYYYALYMEHLAPSLQPKAKAVVKQVPEVAALCAKRKWFKPEENDFPVAGVAYKRMRGDEGEVLEWVAKCRNWAMQFAASESDEWNACEQEPDECMAVLTGEKPRPAADAEPSRGAAKANGAPKRKAAAKTSAKKSARKAARRP